MTSKRALDGESLEDLPASKRARSTWNPVEAVFENQNLVRLIASHLRAENLLPFAFVKKGWSLSILNHDMVIRSVYPNETLKGKLKPVVDLLKRKAIFIPSPIRMLRLVNATKCERCVSRSPLHRLRLVFFSRVRDSFLNFVFISISVSFRLPRLPMPAHLCAKISAWRTACSVWTALRGNYTCSNKILGE